MDAGRQTRRWIASVVAVTMLVCLGVVAIKSNIDGPAILIVIVFQLPLFLPTAIYYRFVKGRRAVLICGTILITFTIPMALFVAILKEPPYFVVGLVFFVTLIASIVGATAGNQSVRS